MPINTNYEQNVKIHYKNIDIKLNVTYDTRKGRAIFMEKTRIEELVKRVIAHDEQAFEELYIEFYPSVYKAAIKLCKNDADAQDITQLTFLQVRRSIHNLEKPSYFPLWINRICVNKCKNLFRDNRLDTYDEEYYKLSNRFIETHRDHVSEKKLRFTTDQEILFSMIDQLKPEQQQLLYMSYFEQMSQDEISVMLQLPIGTIKSRLYAARNQLREKITDYEQKEGVALNFQAEGLGSMIFLYVLHKQISIPVTIALPFWKSSMNQFSSAMSGTLGNVVLVASIATLGLGAYGIYHEVNQPVIPSYVNDQPEITTKNISSFPTTQLDEYTIENEQMAYYVLRGYAYDEQAIHNVSLELLQSMEPAYDALKASNGVFYHVLEDSGWSKAFEERIKK